MNRAVLSIWLALVLATAACSDAPSDESVGDTLELPTDGDGDETSTEATGDQAPDALDVTVGEPSNLADMEAIWAEARAAVVSRLRGGGFGVSDNNVLTGPGDFVIDLDRCPANWNNEAVVDEPIRLIHVLSAADFGPYSQGARAYFEHINNTGGVDGRLIDYEVVDDGLLPTQTMEAVDDRIESNPLAISTFGTPTSQSVFDQLNRECIPQPFVGSAHPAWGDPRSHPWTIGLPLSYSSEAAQWGNWIKRNLAGQTPVKVVALTIDNDYGRAYQTALSRWATSNRDVISEVVVVNHDPESQDVSSQVTEAGAANPDVFIVITAGPACGSAIESGETTGLNSVTMALFLATACTDPQRFLVPNGRAGDGYLAVDGGAKSVGDPAHDGDLFVDFISSLVTEAGVEPEQAAQAGAGAGQFAWAYVEALRIAAELDGGVNRSNLILALRSLDLRHPMLDPGVAFSTDGAADAYPIEGSRMMRYSPGGETWDRESLVIDLNRTTPSCSWDGVNCR